MEQNKPNFLRKFREWLSKQKLKVLFVATLATLIAILEGFNTFFDFLDHLNDHFPHRDDPGVTDVSSPAPEEGKDNPGVTGASSLEPEGSKDGFGVTGVSSPAPEGGEDAPGVTGVSSLEPEEDEEPELTDSLRFTMEGITYTFYLETAMVEHLNYEPEISWVLGSSGSSWIEAHYRYDNPRGEMLYDLTIAMEADIKPGRYNSPSSSPSQPSIMIAFQKDNRLYGVGELPMVKNLSMGFGTGLTPPNAKGSYSLSLSHRSEDWRHYTGTFKAVLYDQTTLLSNTDETISLTDCYFDFTIPDS